MGKYANHEEFGVNAPINYREDTTSESFLNGMTAITPPGMKPKKVRGRKFEENGLTPIAPYEAALRPAPAGWKPAEDGSRGAPCVGPDPALWEPGCVPAGISTATSPSRLGTCTVVPSAASGAATSITVCRSSWSRTNRSSSRTRTMSRCS